VTVLASAGIVFAAMFYTSVFYQALVDGDMDGMAGFARIVIPDTFFYKTVSEGESAIAVLALSRIKNAVGPGIMWYVAGYNWYSIVAINGVLIFLSLLYLSRIKQYYGLQLSTTVAMVLYIGLAPIFVYYSIGAIKELPTLFGLLGFFYHYLKNQRKRWLIYVLMLIFFRYQIVFPIVTFITLDKVSRKPLKASILIMLAIACIYPYIRSMNVFGSEATELFREDRLGTSGAFIEHVRETIPVLSVFAVMIRVGQSMFEPLLTFYANPTFLEHGDLSVYLLLNVLQNLTLAPYWIFVAIAVTRKAMSRKPGPRDIERLYALMVLFVVPIGGFSFIHQRYLFPITGILLIAGMMALKARKPFRPFRRALMIGRSAEA
jgi:hypothetical protein